MNLEELAEPTEKDIADINETFKSDHGTYKQLREKPTHELEKLDALGLQRLAEEPEVIAEEEPEKKDEVQDEPEKKDDKKEEIIENDKSTKVETPLGDIEIPVEKKDVKKDVAPEEDDTKAWEEVSGSQSKQKNAFIGLRKELKNLKETAKEAESLKARLQELEARGPEVKVDPELQTRAEAMEKRLKEVEEENKNWRKDAAVFRIEKSDEYTAKVTTPFKEEIAPTIQTLEKATRGVLSKPLLDKLALMDEGSANEEILKMREGGEIDRDDLSEFRGLVRKYRDVIKAKTYLTQNAEHVASLQTKQQQDAMEASKKEYLSELGAKLTVRDKALADQFFAQVQDPELKGLIENSRSQMGERLKAFNWYEAPVEAQAAVMAGVKNYPIVVAVMGKQISTLESQLTEAQTKVKELEKAQERLTKATPAAGRTTGGETKTDGEPQEYTGKLDAASLSKIAASA